MYLTTTNVIDVVSSDGGCEKTPLILTPSPMLYAWLAIASTPMSEAAHCCLVCGISFAGQRLENHHK